MRFTAGDIADQLGGKVLGDRTMPLTGFQAADRARAVPPGDPKKGKSENRR